MNLSFEILKTAPYRVILCRYNEISLKSLPYQNKMFNVLIESIKKICIREHLHLQSALNLKGRLVFFFPNDQISAAVIVFRYIIGIQSISPAISVNRKYEVLKRDFLKYASNFLNDGDSFSIALKITVSYSFSVSKLKKEFYQMIKQHFGEKGIKISIKKKNPTFKFKIEIREKGTYIYHKIISTRWGGLPIESQNTLLIPWRGDSHEMFAAEMLLKRGSIITPVIFNNSESYNPLDKNILNSKIIPNIQKLAKYYADPIPLIIIPVQKLISSLKSVIPQKNNIIPYIYYAFLLIIEQIIMKSREISKFKYGERKLHYKGFISAITKSQQKYLLIGQQFGVIQFIPLFAFSQQKLLKMLEISNLQPNYFSFSEQILLDNTNHNISSEFKIDLKKKTNENLTFQYPSFLSSVIADLPNQNDNIFPSIKELNDFFTQLDISTKLNAQLQNIVVKYISGTILNED